MTTKDRLPPYEEIEALLPWYVNGTLDSQLMRLVEEALKTSAPLRHALDLAREDRDAVVDANELVSAPRSDVLARVMAEIAADPKTFQSPAR